MVLLVYIILTLLWFYADSKLNLLRLNFKVRLQKVFSKLHFSLFLLEQIINFVWLVF